MQTVSNTQPTTVGITGPSGLGLTPQQQQELTLTVQPGTAVGMNGQKMSNVQVGISTVPPQIVMDMLPAGVMQHTFDITIQAPGVATFSTPAQLTFPNVFDAAPGTQLNVLSFDHTTGRLVIDGTATVSPDGLTVVTDPGTGVTQPGWHGLTPPGKPGGPPPPPPPPPCKIPPSYYTNLANCLQDATATYAICIAAAAATAVIDPPAGLIAYAACNALLAYQTYACLHNNPPPCPPTSPNPMAASLDMPADMGGMPAPTETGDPIADQIISITNQILALVSPYMAPENTPPQAVINQVNALTTQANMVAGGNADEYLLNFHQQVETMDATLGQSYLALPANAMFYCAQNPDCR